MGIPGTEGAVVGKIQVSTVNRILAGTVVKVLQYQTLDFVKGREQRFRVPQKGVYRLRPLEADVPFAHAETGVDQGGVEIEPHSVVRPNFVDEIGKIRFEEGFIGTFTVAVKIQVFQVIGRKSTATGPQVDVADHRQTQVEIVIWHAPNVHHLGLGYAGKVVEGKVALSDKGCIIP